MCVSGKWIYNKYIRQSLFVDCGHCPACLQQKANKRTQRIKNNLRDDEVCIFLTCTYAPECVPYIKRTDLVSKNFPIPIYRQVKRYQAKTKKGLRLHQSAGFKPEQIGEIEFIEPELWIIFSLRIYPYCITL